MLASLSDQLVSILLKIMAMHGDPASTISPSEIEDWETKIVDLLKMYLHRVGQSCTMSAANIQMSSRDEALNEKSKALNDAEKKKKAGILPMECTDLFGPHAKRQIEN